MAIISLHDATLAIGGKTLFRNANFQMDDTDRVGLIGPNGCGKTTLFRFFDGQLELEHGSQRKKRGLRVGYLAQDITLSTNQSLIEFVRDSVPGRKALEEKVLTLETALQHGADSEDEVLELSTQLADVHERLADFESLYSEHVALGILAGLGFQTSDHQRKLSTFSGGWKMRAVLSSFLFMQPDLLLLDEPTNHLDMPSVAWFSSFLKRYKRAFVLISHDRDFLNEQIGKVVSFEPEGLRTYSGNFDQYLIRRSEEQQVLINRAKNQQREREKAQEFIDRFRYQAAKAKAVQSRIKALKRMEQVDIVAEHQVVSFTFPPTKEPSKHVLSGEGLAKCYGDVRVFDNVDLNVLRGEKIGVIGTNGAGKTTLLKILAGELKSDSGFVKLGHNVTLGYYAQHHTETLDPERSVYDEVASVVRDMPQRQIRSVLGSLLFSGDDVKKSVAVLSGGERARVALAKLLLSPVNLLLMDEPTNHLDLQSSEGLASALTTFDGTLIFVSHNRSFVRQLATRIWNVAEGTLETYPGTLDEYMQSSIRQLGIGERTATSQTSQKANPQKKRIHGKERRRAEAAERARKKQHSAPIKETIARLELRIGELETLQSERSRQLADPDVYADASRSAELIRDFGTDATALGNLQSQWEAAVTQLEKLKNT